MPCSGTCQSSCRGKRSRSGRIRGLIRATLSRKPNFLSLFRLNTFLAEAAHLKGVKPLESISKVFNSTHAHDLSRAIPHYRRAIALDPNLGGAHNNLAISLYAQGDFTSAIEEWRRAVKSKSSAQVAIKNLMLAVTDNGIAVLPVDLVAAGSSLSALESIGCHSFIIRNEMTIPIYSVQSEAYNLDGLGNRVGGSVLNPLVTVVEPGTIIFSSPSQTDFQINSPALQHLDALKMPNLHIDVTFSRQTMRLPEKASFFFLPEKSPEGYWRWAPQLPLQQ